MSKLSIEEIHKQNIGKVSDKWSSYLPVYDELLFFIKADAIIYQRGLDRVY